MCLVAFSPESLWFSLSESLWPGGSGGPLILGEAREVTWEPNSFLYRFLKNVYIYFSENKILFSSPICIISPQRCFSSLLILPHSNKMRGLESFYFPFSSLRLLEFYFFLPLFPPTSSCYFVMEAHIPVPPPLRHASQSFILLGMYFAFSLWLLAPFRWHGIFLCELFTS